MQEFATDIEARTALEQGRVDAYVTDYTLPYLRLVWSYYACVLIATSLIPAAFCSESLMAGMNTIAVGQIEAARSLGMTFFQTLKNVVLPQVLRSVVLPMTNLLVATMLTTALASQVPLNPQDLTGLVSYINTHAVGGVTAGLLAFATGLLLMLARISRSPVARGVSMALIEFSRGVPTLLFIYFFFLVAPQMGLKLPAFWKIAAPVAISAAGVPMPQEGKKLAGLRSQIGMVFQSFNLFAHKTILYNVTIAPIDVLHKPKKEAQEEAMQLLRRVGVDSQAAKVPAQLSGGQQQRVAIARRKTGGR